MSKTVITITLRNWQPYLSGLNNLGIEDKIKELVTKHFSSRNEVNKTIHLIVEVVE